MTIYAICFTICFTLLVILVIPIEKIHAVQEITDNLVELKSDENDDDEAP